MGIFDKISHAIFGTKTAAAAEMPASATTEAPVAEVHADAMPETAAPAHDAAATEAHVEVAADAPASDTHAAEAAAPTAIVDVASIMDAAVEASDEELDWRHSIVDMMKALGMESTLAERKELAAELHYTGDTHDSAAMNIWLHSALLAKLAENGGHVPADLLK